MVRIELVRPSYRILSFPEDAERFLEWVARTCYKSEDRITPGSQITMCNRLIESKHESVLEHLVITVKFVIDRGVSHEFVRHRLASYTQKSTRYVNCEKKGYVFVIPPWLPEVEPGTYEYHTMPGYWPDDAGIWFQALGNSAFAYQRLLEGGWTPQQARTVLQNSLETELVVTANIREWRHILKLRTASSAHPQFREVACPLLGDFLERSPILFQGIQ